MPEGPEIWRAAARIEKTLGGGPLVSVVVGLERLEPAEGALLGACVLAVRPRGKALLTSFSTGHTLYSHNQLYGVWRVAPAGAALRPTTRALRLSLSTAQGTAALYSATDIELWPTDSVHQHPFLQRVGPDVLDPDVDLVAVTERLRTFRHRRRRLGGLLLDQGFFCGVGNYLRAEILWTASLHPSRTLASLSDDERGVLATALLEVPRASLRFRYARGERRFTFAVFGRAGRPCPRCGEAVVRTTDGGRRLYLCETCQPL
jgi:endonuclease-8